MFTLQMIKGACQLDLRDELLGERIRKERGDGKWRNGKNARTNNNEKKLGKCDKGEKRRNNEQRKWYGWEIV